MFGRFFNLFYSLVCFSIIYKFLFQFRILNFVSIFLNKKMFLIKKYINNYLLVNVRLVYFSFKKFKILFKHLTQKILRSGLSCFLNKFLNLKSLKRHRHILFVEPKYSCFFFFWGITQRDCGNQSKYRYYKKFIKLLKCSHSLDLCRNVYIIFILYIVNHKKRYIIQNKKINNHL